jgi:hypothetical protein
MPLSPSAFIEARISRSMIASVTMARKWQVSRASMRCGLSKNTGATADL